VKKYPSHYIVIHFISTDRPWEAFLFVDTLIPSQSFDIGVFLSPVKPNAPFNLTVNRMSSQHHVTWMSSYEKYLQFGNLLSDNLKYQLWFYRSGHQGNVRHSNTVVEVPHSTNISVNNENFEPDTEYTVNVRSIPNQQQYQGQWSEWATEVLGEFPTNTFTHYNNTLCSGADLFKTEETLQIDTLTETIPVWDDDHSSLVPHHMIQEGPSDNLSNPAVSLSEPESTIEADSGCWLHSTTSLERESAWYSNVNSSSDYCTLSDTGNCQELTPCVY
uniref:Fibronectin type-III domain-containing protein n=1 Tax=Oncorhynchus tshawytscha TaxID=74940 RepID=A0A8C8CAK4_ONCTS